MGFSKGDPRINRKGPPTKEERGLTIKKAYKVMAEMGFDPIAELVKLYRTTKDEALKLKIGIELQKYREGIRKEIDGQKDMEDEQTTINAQATHSLLKELEALEISSGSVNTATSHSNDVGNREPNTPTPTVSENTLPTTKE